MSMESGRESLDRSNLIVKESLGRSSHAPYYRFPRFGCLGSSLPNHQQLSSELDCPRELLVPDIEVEPFAYIIVSGLRRSIIFPNSHPLPPRIPLEDGNSSKPGITLVRHMALCMLCNNMSTADQPIRRIPDEEKTNHPKVICAFRSVFAPTAVILTSFNQQLVLASLRPSRMFMVGVTARHLDSIAGWEPRTQSYSTK